MTDNIWTAYSPGEAERGKFVTVDTSTITDYPTGSRGRYAVLVSPIPNSNSLGTSGCPMYTTLTTIISTVELDITGAEINVERVQEIIDPVTIDEVQNDVTIRVRPLTETAMVCSITLLAGTSAVFNFDPPADLIEVYNNSNNFTYFYYDSAVSFEDLTGRGMVIAGESFYSIEKDIISFVVGSISGSDLRIFAHDRDY